MYISAMKGPKTFSATMSLRDLSSAALVFLVYFVTARISLYVYFHFHTSPALIWPPVGIALAAVLFGGYRMTVPIFLAQFLALSIQLDGAILLPVITGAAYAMQSVAALFIARRLNLALNIDKMRNALILIGLALFVTLIAPLISTALQLIANILTVSPSENIGRAWGGGMFSVLVITSFIASWYPWKNFTIAKREALEIVAAFTVLFVNNYLLFWTLHLQMFGVGVIFFLPAIYIWFALRFHVRWFTLALLSTSIIAIAGTIIAHPSTGALSAQLLSDEIYIGLLAALFFPFMSVVEERRIAFHDLEHAYEITTEADKAKNEFIAILAHELRNPLAPIVSSLELLKLETQSESALETIRIAESHTEMIKRLLDDLLDTARLTQKKFKLQKETVDVRTVLEQSVANVESLMRSRAQAFTSVMDVDGMILFADPVRIKQIIINVLNNASKYSPVGSAVSLHARADKNMLEIRISDNGLGIESRMLERIFEPFKQIESKDRSDAGLGIGLFLTKRLCELHGGTVRAESAGKGLGSTFTIRLPLSLQMPLENVRATVLSGNVAPCRILIVDDNQAAAGALQKLLRAKGHTVQVAYSGARALADLNAFSPTVVLLDLGMPEMDGYETARRIRAQSAVKIVALSGYGQEIDRLQTARAGFDKHLVKPVSVDEIQRYLFSLQETSRERVG